MSTSFDPLQIRRRLGRDDWLAPTPFGPDGWVFDKTDRSRRIIISCSDMHEGGVEWVHASISGRFEMPTYDDLTMMHRAVYGDGFAYQCFVPSSQHISIHERALHLWGRLDGAPVLPEFGLVLGTI